MQDFFELRNCKRRYIAFFGVLTHGGFFCFLCLLFFACQAQIRYTHEIRHDRFLSYLNPKYRTWKAKAVIQDLEKGQKISSRQHDKAMALTYSLAWNQAEILWKTNLKESPEFLANYLSLSRLYFLLEEREGLKQLHSQLVQNKKIYRSKIYMLAQNLYSQGRTREALLLMQSLENHSANPSCPAERSCYLPASLWLADYYFAEPNYKKTYFYYMRVIESKVRHPQALWGLAKLAYLGKQWEKVVVYLQLVQQQKKISPKIRKESYYLLANAYFQTGEISRALEQIKKIPKRKHNYASLSLYGDILLIKDFRADLNALLGLASSEKFRLSLLRHWYGLEKVEGLKHIHSSFAF